MRYEFHVGDYVETVDGKVGYITKVDCLYIPYFEYKVNGGVGWQEIGNGDSKIWELKLSANFNRIGKYDFTKPEQPKEIDKLNPDWRGDEAYRKINELVDAVNELRKGRT